MENLPIIQKRFQEETKTVADMINHKDLHLILNPVFTSHYFVDALVSTPNNVISTKHTTGASAPNGGQTEEQENNAYEYAKQIKEKIKNAGAFLEANKAFIYLGGKKIRIKGLTINNW